MSSTTATGSTLGVLARQEIRNYLRHKLFWFGAALVLVARRRHAVRPRRRPGLQRVAT